MTLETRSEFARRMGWNRSSVTRAVQDGRVVLAGDKVDVDASLQKIDALAHSAPHHRAHAQQLVEERHAKTHAAMNAPAPTATVVPEADSVTELNLRLKRADANIREHQAEIARMDREEKAGNLIQREAVDFAMDDLGATLGSLLDNLADRLAPVVHPLQTIEETHAALSEAAQDIRQTMFEKLTRLALSKKQ